MLSYQVILTLFFFLLFFSFFIPFFLSLFILPSNFYWFKSWLKFGLFKFDQNCINPWTPWIFSNFILFSLPTFSRICLWTFFDFIPRKMIHSFLLSLDLIFLLWIACNHIFFILFCFILFHLIFLFYSILFYFILFYFILFYFIFILFYSIFDPRSHRWWEHQFDTGWSYITNASSNRWSCCYCLSWWKMGRGAMCLHYSSRRFGICDSWRWLLLHLSVVTQLDYYQYNCSSFDNDFYWNIIIIIFDHMFLVETVYDYIIFSYLFNHLWS